MAKKNFLTILYTALLSFLCVFIFSKINQRDLILQLDNHNLTAEAYQINLRQNEKLSKFTKELDDSSEIDNVQVHFQSKKDKNITYFYGKGNFPVPPMVSGEFFSKNDFDSIVNVAVVGQNLKKKLYKPKDQAYLHYGNHYIPVLGIMGENRAHSKLDNQIFIAGGRDVMENLNSNDFIIKIDGRKSFSTSLLKKTFNAASVKRVVHQNTLAQSGSWISNHFAHLMGLIAIVIGTLGGAFLWSIATRKDFQAELFASNDKRRVVFQEWRSFTIYNGVGMIVGTLIGTVVFTLSTYAQLIPFIVILYIVAILLFYFVIKHDVKKLKINL